MLLIIIWLLFSLSNFITLTNSSIRRQRSSKSIPKRHPSYDIAEQKCLEYGAPRYVERVDEGLLPGDADIRTRVLDCVQAEELINAGTPASEKEFPHMAAIGYGPGDFDTASWVCGGSLISQRYVLTAAHCKLRGGLNGGLAKWVRLGELNNLKTLKESLYLAVYNIVEHIVHPKYNSKYKYHDIALFKLHADVAFTTHIRPICLYPTSPDTDPFSKAIITGWGQECAGCIESDVLLKAKVDAMSDSKCSTFFLTKIDMPSGFDARTMVCAYDNIKGSDTCEGDSGGPLQIPIINYTCMYYQVGIVSFGRAICGVKGIPAIYTQISPYIPWIQSIVWPA